MNTPIDSRKLEDLEPGTRARAQAFLAECERQGLRVLVTSTFRNAARQNALYVQGRTAPGQRVTNARAGFSWHNFRRAFDVVPLTDKGKADWQNTAAFRKLGAIGKSVGLEWGGDWAKFPDMPHFQFTQGLNLGEMRARFGGEAPGA